MQNVLKEMDKIELVNIERLAHILKGLNAAELETLEILLDEDASKTISQSLKELDSGKNCLKTNGSWNILFFLSYLSHRQTCPVSLFRDVE